jgi:hypothetical protein
MTRLITRQVTDDQHDQGVSESVDGGGYHFEKRPESTYQCIKNRQKYVHSTHSAEPRAKPDLKTKGLKSHGLMCTALRYHYSTQFHHPEERFSWLANLSNILHSDMIKAHTITIKSRYSDLTHT